jgi:hypothetical protein
VATAIWSIVVVSVAVAVAVAGLILVQRLVPFSVRESHNSHTAAMFGASYVVYGLMVGFSAYLVAFQFDAAQQTVENEANSVEEIYRLAEQLPVRNGGRYRASPSLTPGPWWRRDGP